MIIPLKTFFFFFLIKKLKMSRCPLKSQKQQVKKKTKTTIVICRRWHRHQQWR